MCKNLIYIYCCKKQTLTTENYIHCCVKTKSYIYYCRCNSLHMLLLFFLITFQQKQNISTLLPISKKPLHWFCFLLHTVVRFISLTPLQYITMYIIYNKIIFALLCDPHLPYEDNTRQKLSRCSAVLLRSHCYVFLQYIHTSQWNKTYNTYISYAK